MFFLKSSKPTAGIKALRNTTQLNRITSLGAPITWLCSNLVWRYTWHKPTFCNWCWRRTLNSFTWSVKCSSIWSNKTRSTFSMPMDPAKEETVHQKPCVMPIDPNPTSLFQKHEGPINMICCVYCFILILATFRCLKPTQECGIIFKGKIRSLMVTFGGPVHIDIIDELFLKNHHSTSTRRSHSERNVWPLLMSPPGWPELMHVNSVT